MTYSVGSRYPMPAAGRDGKLDGKLHGVGQGRWQVKIDGFRRAMKQREGTRDHNIVRWSLDVSLSSWMLAGSTGLEPAASGVTGRRSNQLNYDPEI
jgi:hypothetical protein